jgi:hypothetical protein
MSENDKGKSRAGRGKRASGYRSARTPKLKAPAPKPPPLPPLARPGAYDGFGDADEDGLLMLAALETIESLEPDYVDDLAAEASVSIVERLGPEEPASAEGERAAAPGRSLRARLGRMAPQQPVESAERPAPAPKEQREFFAGPVEEATVEIILRTEVSFADPFEEKLRTRAGGPVPPPLPPKGPRR